MMSSFFRLLSVLAAAQTRQRISPQDPILSADLPGGELFRPLVGFQARAVRLARTVRAEELLEEIVYGFGIDLISTHSITDLSFIAVRPDGALQQMLPQIVVREATLFAGGGQQAMVDRLEIVARDARS